MGTAVRNARPVAKGTTVHSAMRQDMITVTTSHNANPRSPITVTELLECLLSVNTLLRNSRAAWRFQRFQTAVRSDQKRKRMTDQLESLACAAPAVMNRIDARF